MGETLRLGSSTRHLDADAVAAGRRVECPVRRGLFVSILPAERYNTRYRQAVQQFAIRQLARGKTSEESEEEFKSRFDDPEFVVDALVADMDGLYGTGDKKVNYTRNRGVAVLSDPVHADVLEWIVREALNFGAYYANGVKDVGNSSRPGSTGKPSGAKGSTKTKP